MRNASEKFDYPSCDLGIYIQPMVQGTSCHCEFNLFYDPNDENEIAKIRSLYLEASETLMNAGAFFSHPYGAVADMAYRRDAETTAALRKTKSIFDPNNILNSGKLCF
jgi:FAD/FMN-containing dehydrogenase